ncbi:MAG: hypothetical protein GTO46_13935 [Gemmatimonadetes bacterium]|nr:hypothetical protein [Gemmatimonadota bacterium]NIO32685.1 hypothetical protein [Gemmatimonadota bacterium]
MYVQPVEETIATLQGVGLDLSLVVREDEWQGRAAYVVGDENRQFWIDKEDLLFLRLLLKNPNTGAEREILFDGQRVSEVGSRRSIAAAKLGRRKQNVGC